MQLIKKLFCKILVASKFYPKFWNSNIRPAVLTVWRNVLNVSIIMYTTFFCRYKKNFKIMAVYIFHKLRDSEPRKGLSLTTRIECMFITGVRIVQIVRNANLPLHGKHLILHQDPLLSHLLFENRHHLFHPSLYHALYLFHGYHLCFVQTVDASCIKEEINKL